jgi:hypothetical protein
MNEERNESEQANAVPLPWRFVHVREYTEHMDLTGKDLIGMLNRTKGDVARLVGKMYEKSEMLTEELPTEFVTTMTGEIADEVHEWPKATLGTEFQHLMLLFLTGRLIGIKWSFDKAPPIRRKAWWKFW